MKDEGAPYLSRTRLFRLFALAAFLLYTAQLWRLQVVEGPTYRQQAENNRLRISQITPPRGIIYDRDGVVLASNAPVLTVAIVPADLPEERAAEVYQLLGQLLGMPPETIEQMVNQRRETGDLFNPVRIRTNVTRELAFQIEEQHPHLPGVSIIIESHRSYTEGPLLAHLLGYLLPISPEVLGEEEYRRRLSQGQYTVNDRVGAEGIERTFEDELRGRPGRRSYEVDASGRLVRELQVEQPTPGHNLLLTVDLDLQRMAAEVLQQHLAATGARSGVVILLDPNNGGVLAMVNAPTYDNNLFADQIDGEAVQRLLNHPDAPLFHRAIAGRYPLGSFAKLVTALAALGEGTATPETTVTCDGGMLVPDDYNPAIFQRLPDFDAHGDVDLRKAVATFCNVYFYHLGGGYQDNPGLGWERLAHWARLMGFGEPTGIALPAEDAGTVADRELKLQVVGEDWLRGDTYAAAVGHRLALATPIQIATAMAAIANGGALLQPKLVAAVTDSEGRALQTIEPSVRRQLPIAPEHLAVVRQGLRDALADALPDAAGQVGPASSPRSEEGPGWFAGFLPAERPTVVAVLYLDTGGPAAARRAGIDLLRSIDQRQIADAASDDAVGGCCEGSDPVLAHGGPATPPTTTRGRQ
ncbi:MAG TPA: penicillin-binding protein 2 [Chloroflexota bacterium]